MSEEPQQRHWTKASIEFLSSRLALPYEPTMQDWAWTAADAKDLDKYLLLFSEVIAEPDIRFTLADIIIQAFEDVGGELDRDHRWQMFLSELERNFEIHACQVWYWSAFENDLNDAWRVSPQMRALYRRANP